MVEEPTSKDPDGVYVGRKGAVCEGWMLSVRTASTVTITTTRT